jgi:hypothetical protein
MAFTTLEQRFNQVSEQIYNRFQPSPDQRLVVLPNTRGGNLITGAFKSTSRIKDDSRLLPTVSFIRDTKRLTEFLTSPEGIRFAGKQFLLQSGNTFVNTRVYGGPFTNIMLPGTHTLRHFEGIGRDLPSELRALKISRLVQEIPGMVQVTTVDSFKIAGTQPDDSSPISTFLSPLRNIYSAIVTPTEQLVDLIFRRPEFKVYSQDGRQSYNPVLRLPETLTQRSTVRNKIFEAGKLNSFNLSATLYGRRRTKQETFTDPYFFTPGFYGTLNPRSSVYENIFRETNEVDLYGNKVKYVNVPFGEGSLEEIKYTQDKILNYDPLNVSVSGSKLSGVNPRERKVKYTLSSEQSNNKLINYEILKGERFESESPDIINFAFQTTDTNAPIIKFRAFISTLKQSTKPEYNEQKYLGRTERFVTYAGARRTASMTFNVVAFSASEIDAVWTKINYLTGLAFPLAVSNSGFMVPPLFKISIGKIYDAQPCYIENLDFDLIDDTITFDIDKQVSQYINVNMSIVLLEKRSRYYNSPFYQITQDLVDQK